MIGGATMHVRLQMLLDAYEMGPKELAKKLDVSRQTVHNWLNQTGEPKASQLLRMSEIFKVSVNWIVAGREIKDSYETLELILEKSL